MAGKYVSIEYVCAMMMRKGFRSKEMTISEFMDILKPSDVVPREDYEKIKLPSAQPEIVRCGDCYHYPGEYTDCPMIGWARNGEDFCSKAERRADGEKIHKY